MFKVTGSLLGSWNIKVTEGTSSGQQGGSGGGDHQYYKSPTFTIQMWILYRRICPRSHGQAMIREVLRTLRPHLARVTTAGHDFLPQSWDLPRIGVLVPPQGSAWPPLYSPLHLRLG